jgi:dynein intermediate chain 2
MGLFPCLQLNTIRVQYDQHGMNHTEGGWPREINPADEEQTVRFKKKIEKDEMYIHTVLQLTHVRHNNDSKVKYMPYL